MTRPSFLLTTRQLAMVWQDLDFGRLPYPLDVPATDDDPVAERGQAHPDLTALLRLLADHSLAVDAVADLGRPLRAIAASDRDRAVLAVLDKDSVRVREIRPTALARSIVDILPENVSGPGAPRTLRVETLNRAVRLHEDHEETGADPWGTDELDERAALARAGLSGEDAKAVADLAANRIAGGQFGMSYVDSKLTAKRATTLITWFDTHQGRYLMVRDKQWLSIASTDNDRITARIAAVLTTVAPNHHHIASIR